MRRCFASVYFLAAFCAASDLVQVVVTTNGQPRPTPLLGFGGEYVFQSVADASLDAALAGAASAGTRFPGGTPSDYFNWRTGWLRPPPNTGCGGCDELPWRPTQPAALAAYLSATQQAPVLVVNQLTAPLSDAVAGFRL